MGIETSCDETGVAIVEDGRRILSNMVSSQIPIHAEYGGVVPELASRNHVRTLPLLAREALRDAKCSLAEIDAFAVTQGPGLVGSLLVGLNYAKSLAYVTGKPLIPLHHIEGHMYAPFMDGHEIEFPFVSLVVSGGHTSLIACHGHHKYELMGRTRDDAVGEAFDKIAKLVGLSYPGGLSVQLAAKKGNEKAFSFPRPLMSDDSFDFSFSGLKTAVLYQVQSGGDSPTGQRGKKHIVDANRKANLTEEEVADICASFEQAALDVLVKKTRNALREADAKRLVVAGGFAAHERLRERLRAELGIDESNVYCPSMELCLDNGAMIACAGYFRLQNEGADLDLDLNADAGLQLEYMKRTD
ncbi:tRNA (adenosine(37)-N6)-threonylcarbamoyltransferase complex transferase subunit TsaD [Candidatus Hydrogenedentota bacterium]